MKQVLGVWIPDSDPDAWIHKSIPLVDGYPSYQYEQLTACVKACDKRLHTVVDGGAHVGLWAYHLAKHFKHVAAFEPIASNFKCLEKNVACRSNVTCYPLALGAHDGLVKMIRRHVKSFGFNVDPLGNIDIPCRKLDTIELENVDLIKLDVEGYEYEVLQGAQALIEKWRPVIMIEEKLDPDKRATKYLKHNLGMRCVYEHKCDYLFTWS